MLNALRIAFLLVCGLSLPHAFAAPYQAGITRMAVPDGAGPANAVVWYPTRAAEVAWQAPPFKMEATQGAPVAEGRFPVVVLSHGRQGGPLSHRELAAHLAREGFIVVAPAHLGDTVGQPLATDQSQVLMARPRQAIAALNTALQDARLASHADPARIGMVGFSAGGYTALVLAGAQPDFAHASAYCDKEGREETGSCASASSPNAEVAERLRTWQPPSEPRLKAVVLLDPLAIMFSTKGLARVQLPVLLYRPQDDAYMGAQANALALAKGLPAPPTEVVVPGRHFVFVDPCPEAIADQAALICKDPPGVDRPSIHRKLERDIADFLKQTL